MSQRETRSSACLKAHARKTLGGHLVAGFGAGSAGVDTFIHFTDLFAGFSTGLADLGANSAGKLVVSRVSQHESGAHVADFGTIEHAPEMFRGDMFPADF